MSLLPINPNQQAVYRDGRNPTFWCSTGVLYFQINQFRDALDAYSCAICINPYISEHLQLLKNAQATGGQLPAAPGPQDVHPTAYASAVVPPPGLTGPPLLLQSMSTRPPIFQPQSSGPPSGDNLHLPPPAPAPASRSSPGPFRGGPPPPVVLDESRHMPSHTPLAPMDVDRPPHTRDSGPLLLQSTSTRPPIFRPQSSSSNMAIPFPTTTFRPPLSPPLPMAWSPGGLQSNRKISML
ncbi:hypothetical protein BD769DRAFT_1696446 [Suillus cothurnatus]|nr:hypothetical protein BD769DRAFT_1696446 [Suillus cothurnatus]